ncbi:MAG: hypothetical protein LUB83_05125 [Prevotellaceae bacterium]|nr:hypothetical protein [Prevotellaceae bacterium]
MEAMPSGNECSGGLVELSASHVYKLSERILFHATDHILWKNGKAHTVAPQTCILLKAFITADNHALSLEEIDRLIWNGKSTSDCQRTLIKRLRGLLKDTPLVLSYEGNGVYKLINGEKRNSILSVSPAP